MAYVAFEFANGTPSGDFVDAPGCDFASDTHAHTHPSAILQTTRLVAISPLPTYDFASGTLGCDVASDTLGRDFLPKTPRCGFGSAPIGYDFASDEFGNSGACGGARHKLSLHGLGPRKWNMEFAQVKPAQKCAQHERG